MFELLILGLGNSNLLGLPCAWSDMSAHSLMVAVTKHGIGVEAERFQCQSPVGYMNEIAYFNLTFIM